jgi:hypothetical protein
MNQRYKIVFNRGLQLWQVVSESAKSSIGRGGGNARRVDAALGLLGCIAALAANPAQATNYTVPDGVAFNAPAVTPSPFTALANGDSVTLLGDAVLTTALSINGTISLSGVATGSVLTLNSSGVHGYFNTAAGATLNLGDLSISGGQQAGSGGAINALGALVINSTGALSFTNNGITAEIGRASCRERVFQPV